MSAVSVMNGGVRPIVLLLSALLAAGCGGGGSTTNDQGGSSPTENTSPADPVNTTPQPSEPDPDPQADPDPVISGPQPATARRLDGFDPISEQAWDETAVRKVLQVFAYGGHATDEQIETWANMIPDTAITQILTFDQHNLLLSPLSPVDTDNLDTRDGTMLGLGLFWSSDDPDNGVYSTKRAGYQPYAYDNLIWTRSATSRGLNPFRQKIGLWETNYHMAVNKLAGVTSQQIVTYYDDILGGLEQGLPYQDVLSIAALSAAVATQYGHRTNAYINGKCRCNEDFAREYHQLFFGILGDYDPSLHETVSIKNTAKALTGMPVDRNSKGDLLDTITFDPDLHYPGPLEILNVELGGNTAEERIDQLSQYAIEHEESLDNLPVMIIQGLADDNLTEEKKGKIRMAWRSMQDKNLLDFLRAYAISDLFHDASRVKFWTSIDRNLQIVNAINLSNKEAYLDLYWPDSFEDEGVFVFSPIHNVFGGQTGTEAANSADIFRTNYNRIADGPAGAWYRRASITRYGQNWVKDWAAVVSDVGGQYPVRHVAEWLWQRFIADGLKNLGELERMHLYALLATDYDIGYLFDPDDPDRVLTSADLSQDAALAQLVSDLANAEMNLSSTDPVARSLANRRIGQAINFIVATPYIFAQEGG